MTRWRRFCRRTRKEKELEQEITAHLAMETQQRVERAESLEEARFNARKDFGSVELVKEVTRGMWASHLFDRLEQDARYAAEFTVRMFGAELTLSVVTMLSLSLALAANAAIFSTVNALLLKGDRTIGRSDELVRISRAGENQITDSFSYQAIVNLRERSDVFSGVAAYDEDR